MHGSKQEICAQALWDSVLLRPSHFDHRLYGPSNKFLGRPLPFAKRCKYFSCSLTLTATACSDSPPVYELSLLSELELHFMLDSFTDPFCWNFWSDRWYACAPIIAV